MRPSTTILIVMDKQTETKLFFRIFKCGWKTGYQ